MKPKHDAIVVKRFGNLGMAFTSEQAYRTLAALQPAPIFLQSYESKRLSENLDIYFGPPEEFFIAPDTQQVYTRGRRVPILDDGNFGLVTSYDPVVHTLIQMDVESPQEDRTTFQHWQQYLADLMIHIAESIESAELRISFSLLILRGYLSTSITPRIYPATNGGRQGDGFR